MPTPEEIEYADLLLRKARSDAAAARILAKDLDLDDGVVGFHAQQAVEKAMKVALALSSTEIPRTHDLEELAAIASDAKAAVPDELNDLDWLNPWAVTMRYDEAPTGLDREEAVAAAEAAVSWAAERLATANEMRN